MHHKYKSHTPGNYKHNIIKFQALADSPVYFPYLVRAPFRNLAFYGYVSMGILLETFAHIVISIKYHVLA